MKLSSFTSLIITISPSAGERTAFFLLGGFLSGSRKKLTQKIRNTTLRIMSPYLIHPFNTKKEINRSVIENAAHHKKVFKPYLVIIFKGIY
jgi:hypothetical protein